MHGWSINLFRIGGIQLSIHASFFPLLAYVSWEGWGEAGIEGAIWSIVYISALFVCVTLHELGHAYAASRFGVRVPRILLLPIGGMAEMERIPRRPRDEIIIAMAGPAVNYVLIGLLFIFVRFPAGWDPGYFSFEFMELGRHLILVNLMMGVFNLLPAFPMDGGRVFRALLARKLPYLRATQIAVGVSKVIAILGATYLVYNGHYLGGVLFIFIIFAAGRELRSVVQMEAAERYWIEWQARMVTPLEEDPDKPRLL